MKSLRPRWLLPLVLLLLPLLFGCAPQVAVPDSPTVAMEEGAKKEDFAKKAEEAKSGEAARLKQDVLNYYSAVASRYAKRPEGMKAALKVADEAKDATARHSAWMLVRGVLRQNPTSQLPEKATLESKRIELEKAMDTDNSGGFFYRAMDLLVRLCGGNSSVSPVIAIFVLSIIVAALLWPLQKMQYKSFKELAKHQPEMKRIQERYKSEPMLMNQKMREFYAQHGINPTAGCLPLIVQMVITIVMLQLVWVYQFRFSDSHFLWINPTMGEQSLHWPGYLRGILGHNLGELDIPMLLLYAASQFAQSKLIPPPADPTQAEIQKTMTTFMPIFYFLWMFQNQMPSALMLYYFVSTLFGMWRQWTLNRQFPRDETPVVLSGGDAGEKKDGGESAELKANPRLISPKNARKGGKR